MRRGSFGLMVVLSVPLLKTSRPRLTVLALSDHSLDLSEPRGGDALVAISGVPRDRKAPSC